MKRTTANVKVLKSEYARLKRIDRQFGALLSYASNLLDIKKTREDATAGRLISQEALFRTLGLGFLAKEPNIYPLADLRKKY
ncbi:MAG: hypothetical protein AAB767_03740 [Patescibacteria group bacterium]